jgi:hypothetical protein
MVKLFYLTLLLIGAFTVASWFGSSASSQETGVREFNIEVSSTGAHPAGKSWDGTRVFLLPWEMTTVTPPDLELCIVTLDQTRCEMGGKEFPICPDAERCKFEAVSIPLEEPFGVVVFDVDNFGGEFLDVSAKVAESTRHALGTLREDDVASIVGDDAADWIMRGSSVAGQLAGDAAATLEETDAKSLEWLDAMILLPNDHAWDRVQVDELSAKIRDLIFKNAPISLMASWKNRMRGRFQTQAVLDCTWPSPPCETAYATIQLFSHD